MPTPEGWPPMEASRRCLFNTKQQDEQQEEEEEEEEQEEQVVWTTDDAGTHPTTSSFELGWGWQCDGRKIYSATPTRQDTNKKHHAHNKICSLR